MSDNEKLAIWLVKELNYYDKWEIYRDNYILFAGHVDYPIEVAKDDDVLVVRINKETIPFKLIPQPYLGYIESDFLRLRNILTKRLAEFEAARPQELISGFVNNELNRKVLS